MAWRDWLLGLFGRRPRVAETPHAMGREPATHVIILDGTLSTLKAGHETNAGLAFRLLQGQQNPNLSVYYEAGIQWRDWKSGLAVLTGRGIDAQICRAYGVLASRYRPGDQIFLIGYSRGAYGVRSIAGMIDQIGLLKQNHAIERNIKLAYRHYEFDTDAQVSADFSTNFCHQNVDIQGIGVWDTVKALGIRLPILWRFADRKYRFHSHVLGNHIKAGFQALALDETRLAYRPVMWQSRADWDGILKQTWFRGNHSDIGGQIGDLRACRGLSNIPFVWVISNLKRAGLPVPKGWKAQFPRNPNAPSSGNWSGVSIFFLARRKRAPGRDASEKIHKSVPNDHWSQRQY